MNQVAFSTVILRLIGFYIVYNLIAWLAMGLVIPQGLFMSVEAEGQRPVLLGWLGLGVATRAALGIVLVLFAGKISWLLFSEGTNVITDGAINGAALLWVGLSLMGCYFLVSYVPSLVDIGLHWLRAEASDASMRGFIYAPYHSPIGPAVMTVLSLFLIFKSRTISNWVIRVSK